MLTWSPDCPQEELASRISRKLDILRVEQQAVRQEIETNVALGAAVSARVEQLAQPAEADKYATYVEQIGTITSLLLGLSGRLARAENALVSLGEQDADERVSDVIGWRVFVGALPRPAAAPHS